MSSFSTCTDSLYAPYSQPATHCSEHKTERVVIISQPYWNPNSERYETLHQLIQQGRRERALVISRFIDRLFRGAR
jgi:hypothetical protein